MSFWISNVFLYPRTPDFKKRSFNFENAKLNVVFGRKQSGKTVFLDIVNYCLGSSKCDIPVGVIRSCVGWFGVLVVVDETKILLGRACPKNNQKGSDIMYMDYGRDVSIPDFMRSNTTRADVVEKMNEILGHSTESLNSYNLKNSSAHSTFRIAVNMVLQNYTILANRDRLFSIPPFEDNAFVTKLQIQSLLGFATPETAKKEFEHRKLARELNSLENKQIELNNKREGALNATKGWLHKAVEYGVLTIPLSDERLTLEQAMALLKSVVKKRSELQDANCNIPEAARRKADLELRIQNINTSITTFKGKLNSIEQLISQKEPLNRSYCLQVERLEISSWIKENISSNNPNSDFFGYDFAVDVVNDLVGAVQKIEEEIKGTSAFFANLEKERRECIEKIGELEKQMKAVESEMVASLSVFDGETLGYSRDDKLLFLGQLEGFLKQNEDFGNANYQKDIDRLTSKIQELSEEIQQAKTKSEASKKTVEKLVQNYCGDLQAEYYDEGVIFDVDDLRLLVSVSGVYQPMGSIGSSYNSLVYHTATELALLQYGRDSMKNNLLPSFAILDQPSQCLSSNSTSNDTPLKLEDEKSLREYYKIIKNFCKNRKCQIVVLEHDNRNSWGSDAHIVADFSDLNASLIPCEWINFYRDL